MESQVQPVRKRTARQACRNWLRVLWWDKWAFLLCLGCPLCTVGIIWGQNSTSFVGLLAWIPVMALVVYSYALLRDRGRLLGVRFGSEELEKSVLGREKMSVVFGVGTALVSWDGPLHAMLDKALFVGLLNFSGFMAFSYVEYWLVPLARRKYSRHMDCQDMSN